jgi:putative oxidoreductase
MVNSLFVRLHQFFEPKKEYGAIFLRVIIGWRLVYGTQDNVFSWTQMIDFKEFLADHNVAYPLVAAFVSVYAQFICGILFVLGFLVRPAAIIMIINFMVALVVVHFGTTFLDSFPALMMLFGSIFFMFYGAGKLSLDNWNNTRRMSNP